MTGSVPQARRRNIAQKKRSAGDWVSLNRMPRRGLPRVKGAQPAESITSTGQAAEVIFTPWRAELYVPLILDEMWMETIPSASPPSSSYTCLNRPGDACNVLGNSALSASIEYGTGPE